MQKKKKNKLFIFLIICFVLIPFLFTKGCNYMESLNQAENSISEPISSVSEQIQHSSSAYSHIHERAHNAQVHSIRKANWTGTAVPNSGYVENVYFNTNLSIEDVNEIISSAVSSYGNNEVPLLLKEDLSVYISLTYSEIYNSYMIVDQIGQVAYYSNIPREGMADFEGWNPNIEYPVIINGNVLSSIEEISVGTENSILSNLFSITPFEQSSNNELSIGNLFTQIGNAIIIFGGAVVNVFISMEPIFWNEGPTLIFILIIAAVSFALVFWGIELLISLIGVFKTKRKKKK